MSKSRGRGEEAVPAPNSAISRRLKSEQPESLERPPPSLRELAELRSIPGILVDGMFEKDLVIVRLRSTTARRLLAEVEFEAEKRRDAVAKRRQMIKAKGNFEIERGPRRRIGSPGS